MLATELVCLVTRVGISFNLCAPGASKFGDPAALSSKEVSISGVIISSLAVVAAP